MTRPAPLSPQPRISGYNYVRNLGHGGFSDVHPYEVGGYSQPSVCRAP